MLRKTLLQLCNKSLLFFLLLPQTDCLQQVADYVRGCTWQFPGTPASSITKTGRHDIAKIFMKVALCTKNQSIISVVL
jgi:hypothetical protein